MRQLICKAEIRSLGDGNIEGIAAVYNSPSDDLGTFTEILQPGCFTKSLQENQNIKSLFNHNQDLVIGSRSNSTLELVDASDGLHFTVVPTPE